MHWTYRRCVRLCTRAICMRDPCTCVARTKAVACLTGGTLAWSRPAESTTDKMATGNSSIVDMAANTKSRVHFCVALDLELLTYVRNLNPVRWPGALALLHDPVSCDIQYRRCCSRLSKATACFSLGSNHRCLATKACPTDSDCKECLAALFRPSLDNAGLLVCSQTLAFLTAWLASTNIGYCSLLLCK